MSLQGESSFPDGPLSAATACTVCGAPTWPIQSPAAPLSWDARSIMGLLGLERMTCAVRACPRCLHLFRWPLYDERLVYCAAGNLLRKEAFEKESPGQRFRMGNSGFDADWFKNASAVFTFLSRLLSGIRAPLLPGAKETHPLRILDWGGGDGYLVECLALVSRKVLGVACQATCCDLEPWDNGPSPYFNHLATAQLQDHGPYDLIILSHVLEHTAFPGALLEQCSRHLAPQGLVLIAVPYEQPALLLRPTAGPNPHQNGFSLKSLNRLLTLGGYRLLHLEAVHLSYRIFPMWNLLATAQRAEVPRPPRRFENLKEIYLFGKVLSRLLGTRLRRWLGRKQP